MNSVLAYVGPGTTKEEKQEIAESLWRPRIGRPQAFKTDFDGRDCHPFHGALDWTILGAYIVSQHPQTLGRFAAEHVGIVRVSCEPRSLRTPFVGERRCLSVGKAHIPTLTTAGKARVPTLDDAAKHAIYSTVARAMYAVDFYRLRKNKRERFLAHCPIPSVKIPIERYADEMELLVSSGPCALNRVLLSRDKTEAANLGVRMTVLAYSAYAHGWIDFTL